MVRLVSQPSEALLTLNGIAETTPSGRLRSTFKTELISDRVWRTHEQAELAIVEWVGWYNHARLHSSIGDIPPVEYEQLHAPTAETANQPDGSVAASPARAANGLSSRVLRTSAGA
jgi:hypothetical protein